VGARLRLANSRSPGGLARDGEREGAVAARDGDSSRRCCASAEIKGVAVTKVLLLWWLLIMAFAFLDEGEPRPSGDVLARLA
jgi:hypothetical protein